MAKNKQKPRTHFKYDFIVEGRIAHSGITNDLNRRGQEHKRKYGKGRIKQVGRRTTENAAREWEKTKKKA